MLMRSNSLPRQPPPTAPHAPIVAAAVAVASCPGSSVTSTMCARTTFPRAGAVSCACQPSCLVFRHGATQAFRDVAWRHPSKVTGTRLRTSLVSASQLIRTRSCHLWCSCRRSAATDPRWTRHSRPTLTRTDQLVDHDGRHQSGDAARQLGSSAPRVLALPTSLALTCVAAMAWSRWLPAPSGRHKPCVGHHQARTAYSATVLTSACSASNSR